MTPQKARELAALSLEMVAPNIDTARVGWDADLREDLGLDSLDFLSFVEGLSDESGLRIEEDDYPELFTLNGCVAYLTRQA
ncbi:acyl carrier protein [Actinomadura soli]|uniref:Acyl carrier protein n=1 Tax=Actinomadura soli TaxID=2508997 RepID=A0A5C4JJ88_9ACTN|nr:phosphopantetheine-binding protein [Actinomadura soli]TMR06867.1 acyl carrier protein [Actinomadura soli]